MVIATPLATSERLAVGPIEAAEMLSIKRTRIFALIKSGELRSFKSGKSRLIPTASLTAWVNEQLAEADAERGR